MLFRWSRLTLLVQICFAMVPAKDECDKEVLDEANSLIQKQLSLHDMARDHATHPWDKHIFLVATHHKSGSQLLRNIMAHCFDILGATISCQYGGHGKGITELNSRNFCGDLPAPLRFHNHLDGEGLLQLRQEAQDMHSNLRGVMIVRDPLEMVVSAYCYHHRGAEPTNPMEEGIPSMGPEEGVPLLAERMLEVIEPMAAVYQLRANDLFIVRYENLTHSPELFDASIESIVNFMFDEITDLQRAELKVASQVEDLNRATDLGRSVDNHVNHTSDVDDMAMARACLPLIPADLQAKYARLQEMLGY